MREDLGGGPASENFMPLANQRGDVEIFELAQLRAHIGRIAAKSGVPVNPKHAQVRCSNVPEGTLPPLFPASPACS